MRKLTNIALASLAAFSLFAVTDDTLAQTRRSTTTTQQRNTFRQFFIPDSFYGFTVPFYRLPDQVFIITDPLDRFSDALFRFFVPGAFFKFADTQFRQFLPVSFELIPDPQLGHFFSGKKFRKFFTDT